MRARLPLVAAALDDVIAVRNDAGFDEGLAAVIEIEAPRIAGAVGEDFENVTRRMIAPNCRVHRHALSVRRSRLADKRMREDAVAAIEPAVGAPGERIERLVGVLIAEAVE